MHFLPCSLSWLSLSKTTPDYTVISPLHNWDANLNLAQGLILFKTGCLKSWACRRKLYCILKKKTQKHVFQFFIGENFIYILLDIRSTTSNITRLVDESL